MIKYAHGKNPNSRNGFKKGHKNFITSETRKKMRDVAKRDGRKPPSNKGKKFSKEFKEKARKRWLKDKNPSWKDGISFEKYGYDWTDVLKDSIRQRDNYVCQECGIHQDELSYRLHVHHIDYNKKNCNPNNLISLCRKCHLKTNYNREYWLNYFRNKKYE